MGRILTQTGVDFFSDIFGEVLIRILLLTVRFYAKELLQDRRIKKSPHALHVRNNPNPHNKENMIHPRFQLFPELFCRNT